jgi:3-deoxy-7-phosphoheptulonate synthase
VDNTATDIASKPARQQPQWPDAAEVRRIGAQLAVRPPLVDPTDVLLMRSLLASVSAGEAHVLQAGDCAEDPAECTRGYIARKAGLLDVLAGTLKMSTHGPVLRAGRIAGQFVKPRSQSIEVVAGRELPVYRGHLVNGPEPDPHNRMPDPNRMLACYQAASEAMRFLGWQGPNPLRGLDSPVWTSHEALLLDYELPLLRRTGDGTLVLTSTHWPWIGDRTRQLDGAHVALLSVIANPVACKVGPAMSAGELLDLCERLDPDREPGRLTLIARLGAAVGDRLSDLVSAVRGAGHPVIWLCDPMHANTVLSPDGFKTRYLDQILREVRDFLCVVRTVGGVAGGLHLEVTPDEVTECVHDRSQVACVGEKYTTFCDPRLNPAQAVSVVSAWNG